MDQHGTRKMWKGRGGTEDPDSFGKLTSRFYVGTRASVAQLNKQIDFEK